MLTWKQCQLAAAQGRDIELLLIGGGVMVLVFQTREATRDMDVVILSTDEPAAIRGMARTVAAERGWAEDWLNEGAKGFMVGRSIGPVIFESPGIKVYRPALEQLLAMKLCAWRDDVDIADARRLLMELPPDYNEVWKGIVLYLQPGRELKAKYAFDGLWEDVHGSS
jgi:hypothetical protein